MLKPMLVVSFVIVAIGCTGSDHRAERCNTPPVPETVDPAGTRSTYVVDQIMFPTRASEATEYGFNLDGDELGRIDNALGQALIAFAGVPDDFSFAVETARLVEAGEILHLIEVQATDRVNATGVAVRVLHGVDVDGDPGDNFSGVESFEVDTSRGTGLMTGTIVGGVVHVELGTVPLAVTFPGLQESFILTLQGAMLEGEFTARGFEGRIGGAISTATVRGTLLDVLYTGFSRAVEGDCDADGNCVPDSSGAAVLDYFDTNEDHQLSYAELADSPIMKSLFTADVDLFDDGVFSPLCDGAKDSLSIGIRFTAVPATIASQ